MLKNTLFAVVWKWLFPVSLLEQKYRQKLVLQHREKKKRENERCGEHCLCFSLLVMGGRAKYESNKKALFAFLKFYFMKRDPLLTID
jgi:hypothetical protein